ncbi:MAG: TetR family transcriptional regulator [Myxococcaceae bacterium]|nr:TetR family transcriptional regulator [Myxococcaceae bacterium]
MKPQLPKKPSKSQVSADAAAGPAEPPVVPARRTQAERTAVSNSRLLAAAVRVIAGRGYRAASLQAIGEAAGYSRGLVSHRFGSKEGMLKELLKNIPDIWAEKVRDLVGLDALRTATHAHRDAVLKTPDSMRALYMVMYEAQGELEELRGGFAEWDRMHRARFEKALRAGQRNETIRKDIDVPASAVLYLALLRGITSLWLMDKDGLDLERVYAELDQLLERALGA